MVNPELIETFDRYVMHRIEPGSFTRSCLENNLMEAMGKADIHNRYRLHEICSYIFNVLPRNSWGSHENVKSWLSSPKKPSPETIKYYVQRKTNYLNRGV